jgi:ATP/maltotriose-dependent transcriptional regulator MalT
MAAGLSNREIAERLFVSENTVKTHAGRVFTKLSAQRRTQAVQRAKEAGIIP